MRGEGGFLLRYGSAIAAIALALGVRLLLDPILGEQFYAVAFLIAIALVAWWAGRGPSIVALVLGLLAADYFLVEPRHSVGIGDATSYIGLALFGVAGVAIILVAELYGTRYAYRQMSEYNQQLLAFKERLEQEIADRRQAEENLQRLTETLEQQVIDRTAVAEQRATQLRVLAAELTQAEEHERRRLARILHDHLQQLLVAARMKTTLLRRQAGEEKARETLDQIDGVLSEAITESRSLTVELSPGVLYEKGLAAGLEWLAQQTQEKHELPVWRPTPTPWPSRPTKRPAYSSSRPYASCC